MSTHTARMIGAGIAVLLIALLLVLVSWVSGARPAHAYTAKSCTVYGHARLSVTADAVGPTTSSVHVDLNSETQQQPRLIQDSIQISAGGHAFVTYFQGAVGTDDRWLNLDNRWSYRFRGWWAGSDGNAYVCDVVFAAGTLR